MEWIGFPLLVAAFFVPMFWFFNKREEREHEEEMKRLELECIRQESRRAVPEVK